ncbi:MAG: ferrochelatase [Actinomycetota bacterium]
MSERPPIGVLAMYYGTPSGPDDVQRYYTDIRGGRPPSQKALEDLKRRYAAIGNTFPLERVTGEQARALEAELNAGGPRFRVFLGAKHSPPSIPDVVADMAARGIRRAVGLVLAPHHSRMSVGGYIDRAASVPGPHFTFVKRWYDHPAFVEVLTSRVHEALDRLDPRQREDALVLFTAHSLPARIVDEGDTYPDQLRETAELVAGRLDLPRFDVGWQSAGRTDEPWLGPPLEESIEKAAADGRAAVVVCPCGFVADHLEVLYDVDIEARGVAERAGIRLERTGSMNADPAFIRALAAVVRDHLSARGEG